MDPLQLVAPVFGFVVGTFVVTRVGSWLSAIVDSIRKLRRGEASDSPKSPTWQIPTIIIFHSGLWLLGATIYGAYEVFTGPRTLGWSWFFWGVFAAPILWGAVFWSFRDQPFETDKLASASSTSEVRSGRRARYQRWIGVKRNYVLLCFAVVGVPSWFSAIWVFHDAVKQMTELAVLLGVVVLIETWGISAVLWHIYHPRPWKLPPSKDSREA